MLKEQTTPNTDLQSEPTPYDIFQKFIEKRLAGRCSAESFDRYKAFAESVASMNEWTFGEALDEIVKVEDKWDFTFFGNTTNNTHGSQFIHKKKTLLGLQMLNMATTEEKESLERIEEEQNKIAYSLALDYNLNPSEVSNVLDLLMESGIANTLADAKIVAEKIIKNPQLFELFFKDLADEIKIPKAA